MYLDDLSYSLMQICDAEDLSYERASELCNCSSKHFANIVHKSAYPTLRVFEQICLGFQRTPNELLGAGADDLSFRIPMSVVEVRDSLTASGRVRLPVCPQCRHTLTQVGAAFCSDCGQSLTWGQFKRSMLGGS